ncbi:MAG: hypothetical protein ACRDGE_01530 [Candidatus Limnocylindria bacterium]
MIANIVRIVLILVALLVLFVTALYVEGPAGREVVVTGLVIDLIAIAVIVGVVWSWWRSRRPTPG